MVSDPYKVLEVDRHATPEEIKKAYRKKAKENHPDLHPDDPDASRRMNDINEAYDMLQNPEKYEAARKQQEQRQSAQNAARQGNSYQQSGRSYQGSGYQQGGQRYQETGYRGYQNTGYRGYQGAGGWSSDFGGFGFEDIFGFGEAQYNTTPRAQAGDHPDLVRAINAVNTRRYQEAVIILSRMVSTYRNDRWYYVNAVAHYGMGDTERAQDLLSRAVRMAPGNRMYQWLLIKYRSQGQAREQMWEQRQTSYRSSRRSPMSMAGRFIVGFMILQFVLMLMRMMFYGMMLPY